jgi:hypothetical protein
VRLGREPGWAQLGQLRSRQADDQYRRPGRERDDVVDEVEQRRLGPVDVLEHRDERAPSRQRLEQSPERPRGLVRPARGAEDQARGLLVDEVAQLPAVAPAEHLRERPVRDPLSVRRAAADEHGRPLLQPGAELADEPRLSDARRAEHSHQPAGGRVRRVGEGRLERGELRRAPDEARVLDRGLVTEVDEPPGVVGRLEGSGAADELARARPDEDLRRRGRAHEPVGAIDRCAAREPPAARTGGGEHLSRVDAEPQLRLGLLAQLERGPDRPQGVVLVELVEAEHAHQPADGRALGDAAVALEDGRTAVPAVVQDAVEGLGIEALGQRGGVGEVDAHDRDEAAAAGLVGLRRRFRGQRRLDHRRQERRVMAEDLLLELAQVRPGLEPEVLDEPGTRVAVGLERVGLPPRAVEREHELPSQPLAVRVLGDQFSQLADHLGVAAERQLGVHAPLERRHAQLLQRRDRCAGERRIAQVGQRRSAP